MTQMDQPHEGRPMTPPISPVMPAEVVVSGVASEMLKQTKPWVRFLSILGFVICGLMIVGGALFGVIGAASGQPEMIFMLFLYPLFGVLFIFPSMFLFRYANYIRDFLDNRDSHDLDAALEAQKSFWKFMGIYMLVVLCLYAALIVFGILLGVIAAVTA